MSKRKINWHKWKSVTILTLSGLVMMLKYQNCAPAPVGEAQIAAIEEAGPAGVINEVKSGAVVSFAQKTVEIHTATQAVVLEGICPASQEDAVLGWKIRESASSAASADFARGLAKCAGQKFTIEIAPTQELVCGHEYVVSAQLGLARGGELRVSRRCSANSVAVAPALKASVSDAGATCQIENQSGSCSAVCYSAEGVVENKRDLDPAQCSG
jgi:hypothetical protein